MLIINILFIAVFLMSFPCWIVPRLPYYQILIFFLLGLYGLFVIGASRKILVMKSFVLKYKRLNLAIFLFMAYILLNGLVLSGNIGSLANTVSSLVKIGFFYLLLFSFGTDQVKILKQTNGLLKFLLVFATVFSAIGLLLFLLLFLGVNLPFRDLSEAIKSLPAGRDYRDYYLLGYSKAVWGQGAGTVLRIQSFFSEPGDFAFFLEVPLFLSLGYFMQNTKNLFYLLCFLTNLFAFLLTFSIGGYISFALALLLMLMSIVMKNDYKKIMGVFGISTMLFLIISLIGSLGVFDSILNSYAVVRMFSGSSAGARQGALVTAAGQFLQSPLIGVGFNNSSLESEFVAAFAELGVSGLLLLGFMYFLLIKYAFQNIFSSAEAKIPIAAFLSFGFLASTTHFLFVRGLFTFYFWLVIGLLISLNYCVKMTQKERGKVKK
jgi:hypothetical protein